MRWVQEVGRRASFFSVCLLPQQLIVQPSPNPPPPPGLALPAGSLHNVRMWLLVSSQDIHPARCWKSLWETYGNLGDLGFIPLELSSGQESLDAIKRSGF